MCGPPFQLDYIEIWIQNSSSKINRHLNWLANSISAVQPQECLYEETTFNLQ